MINASDAMNTAKDSAMSAMDTASEAAKTAAGAATKAAVDTKGAVLDAAEGAMSFFRMIKDIDLDDVLGLVGLARKRTSYLAFAAFGGGLVLGAGVAMLVTPVSGRELRKTILRRLEMARGKVEEQKEALEEKAGEIAGEVKETVGEKVDQVKEKVGDVKERAAEVASDVKENVKEKVSEAKEKASHLIGQDNEPEGEEDTRRGRRGRHNQNHLS